jgi:hypothetical protein
MPKISLPWKSEIVRLTLFRAPGTKFDLLDLWTKVIGGEPEDVSEQPLRGTGKVEGTYNSNRMILTMDSLQSRLDWTLTPAPKDSRDLGFQDLGAFDASVDSFFALHSKHLNLYSGIVRIAIGAVAMHPVTDRREGYKNLDLLLPSIEVDVENSSDFMYQINRPRVSVVLSDTIINRISKWGVVVALFGYMNEFPVSGQAPSLPTAEISATRMELDISTDAKRKEEIPTESMPALIAELKGLMHEVANNGDIK